MLSRACTYVEETKGETWRERTRNLHTCAHNIPLHTHAIIFWENTPASGPCLPSASPTQCPLLPAPCIQTRKLAEALCRLARPVTAQPAHKHLERVHGR